MGSRTWISMPHLLRYWSRSAWRLWERPAKCTLCAGSHRLEEHMCGVGGCQVGSGKICMHVTATCANCQGNHQATSTKCPVRHKAEKEARRMRSNKKEQKTKEVIEIHSEPERPSEEPEEVNPDLDMENNDWAGSPPASPLSSIRDYECLDNKNRW